MTPWRSYPHGPLHSLAENIWQVRGTLRIPLPRFMTVMRTGDGKLLIYSAVALDDAGMQGLEALGEPAVLVVPHPPHIMDVPFYKARYPNIRIVAPAAWSAHIAATAKVDATPEEILPALGLGHHMARGMNHNELVLDARLAGDKHALFFCDLFMQAEPTRKPVMKLLGPPKGVGVARIVRFRQVRDRPAARAFLREMANLPNLSVVSGTHGPPLFTGCREALTAAADRL